MPRYIYYLLFVHTHEEESGHEDDDQDVDDMNHTQLPKETVIHHSPGPPSEHEELLWGNIGRKRLER